MIELTKAQHEELVANTSNVVRVVDPLTNAEYMLLPAETYAHLSGMIDVGFHVSDTYRAVDEALAELWSDPKMDDYDRYEELKK
jgi:hypothetical protein